MSMRLLLLPALLAVAFLMGCGGGSGNNVDKGDDATANLLSNAGFESGVDPWHAMDSPSWSPDFDVAGNLAHDGSHSVHLSLTPPDTPALNRVFGVVQDIELTDLPEYVSGYYRVENWQKGTDFQYLQFVVIVFTSDPQTGQTSNKQIRYLLAGAASESFEIGNAKFVFIDEAEPRQSAWVHFGRNIRDDFEELWGSVPQNITSIRVFFEARFDSPAEIRPQMAGDVYYDDLYVGPQANASDG